MRIEADLRQAFKQNDQYLYLVDVDDLIAAWRFQRCNKLTHSYDFSRVPTEYRYSAPPSETSKLMPCHVSFKAKTAHGAIAPVQASTYGGTAACHQSAFPHTRWIPSIDELEAVGFAKRNISPYISPIVDSVTLARVIKDLGITGKVIPKVINGRQRIAFSGYAGQRTIFRGTLYARNNMKIIQMAIGTLGIKHMVKSGARLTIYLTVPLSVLECFLKDEASVAQLLGNVATDVLKVGIAAIIGGAIGIGVATAMSLAAVPILFTIVFCVMAGIAVEEMDKRYGLTRKLIEKIEHYLSVNEEEKKDQATLDVLRHGFGSTMDCHSKRN